VRGDREKTNERRGHIIAICGFNIAIPVGILLALLQPFLGPRRGAWFVPLGVAFYTILVGADDTVIRAAIMGSKRRVTPRCWRRFGRRL